ncbi:MAG TPA: UDP-3-O-(3-hydroxymyristoyl)glucosamine N-acyltransferase [Myxococcota bacterium]|nr:UDP-3-O-(3-hydroxymyristoyl)glucosamine N-acyltransferase [Myxococcota bacterium]
MKLGELAAALELPFEGDGALALAGLASLEDAGPRELAFVTGPKYRAAFLASRGGAFIAPPDFDVAGRACLRSRAPYADFARAILLLAPPPVPEAGVHPTAVIARDAVLGPGVSVGAYSVVGAGARLGARVRIHPHVTVYPGVEIGEDSEIHSGARLRENARLGKRVVVQNGAVIGAAGFGFATNADGSRVRVPHTASVEIGDDCEIGANTTIDASHPGHPRRGRGDARTRLGVDVKVDNQVQIAHGCDIGDHTTVCAQTGLAGSTVVGQHVFLAGRSSSAGHLVIGDRALVGAQTAAANDVAPGAQVLGVPAIDRKLWAKVVAAWNRLPELIKRVRRIEKQLGLGKED